MGRSKKITNIIIAIFMLIAGILLMIFPRYGYSLVMLLLVISLLFYSFRHLFYYFTMARYKVDGISVFYKGLIVLDAGIFALYLGNVPRAYGVFYLIICMLVSGAIDMLQSSQARKLESGHWKYQMFYGLVKVAVAILCFFFLNSARALAYMYGLGLIHSALSRLITALRRTAMVYVK